MPRSPDRFAPSKRLKKPSTKLERGETPSDCPSERCSVERIELTADKFSYTVVPKHMLPIVNAKRSPGIVIVRAKRLEPGKWWIDLVRVGDPSLRGQGLGTYAMRRAIAVLEALVDADTIGLIPHALGHRHDLASWYKRMGFTEVRGEELWRPVAPARVIRRR